MSISKDLAAASAVPVVLAMLSREDSYGYGLVRRLEEFSRSRIKWGEGMIYQVLHRLEKKGWIKSRRVENRRGPDRKYYRLTAKGTQALNDHVEEWVFVYLTIKHIRPKHLKMP